MVVKQHTAALPTALPTSGPAADPPAYEFGHFRDVWANVNKGTGGFVQEFFGKSLPPVPPPSTWDAEEAMVWTKKRIPTTRRDDIYARFPVASGGRDLFFGSLLPGLAGQEIE